jgi:hypothetical protein
VKRLPAFAFGLMVAATIGAFFLTQHLKSQPPVVWDNPFPIPAAFNPAAPGRLCTTAGKDPKRLHYGSTFLNFGISHAGTVSVYIVNSAGTTVATVASGIKMQASDPGSKAGTRTVVWHGLVRNGSIAPDGEYDFQIAVPQAGRNATLIHSPVRVLTVPPRPRVLSVAVIGTGTTTTTTATTTSTATTASTTTASTATTATTGSTTGTTSTGTTTTGPAILSPPHETVAVRFTPSGTPGGYRRVTLDIYRTDVTGKPQLVATLPRDADKLTALWNGEIHNKPAPAGTYLVGITAQNAACDPATWPAVVPPTPGTTPGAGVTIRYLSVTPPLAPAAAGSRVDVPVTSATPITFKLRLAGSSKVLAHGSSAGGSGHARVRLPKHNAGLYELTVRSAGRTATVPLVAYATGAAASRARVLVVLPALTWLGDSPVDDTGDGVPDTLRSGSAAQLDRPLIDGLPASIGDDGALLRYLRSEHFDFQVTTDVALAEGKGPSLVDRWGVLFPDGETYLPSALATNLKSFVTNGGRVLALGTGTFTGTDAISGYPQNPRAAAPVTTKTDLFGAQRGPVTSTHGDLIAALADHLKLLGNAVDFTEFKRYQPIEPPAAEQTHVSAEGIANGSPAIVAYPFGTGTVVEIGLPNFGASLAADAESQQLLANIWRKLAKLR